jgi:hypothetical protein
VWVKYDGIQEGMFDGEWFVILETLDGRVGLIMYDGEGGGVDNNNNNNDNNNNNIGNNLDRDAGIVQLIKVGKDRYTSSQDRLFGPANYRIDSSKVVKK